MGVLDVVALDGGAVLLHVEGKSLALLCFTCFFVSCRSVLSDIKDGARYHGCGWSPVLQGLISLLVLLASLWSLGGPLDLVYLTG